MVTVNSVHFLTPRGANDRVQVVGVVAGSGRVIEVFHIQVTGIGPYRLYVLLFSWLWITLLDPIGYLIMSPKSLRLDLLQVTLN